MMTTDQHVVTKESPIKPPSKTTGENAKGNPQSENVKSQSRLPKPSLEKGPDILVRSYGDLLKAFDIILSKDRPGVRVQFTDTQESVLSRKFLLEMNKDLPTAVLQLKNFLTKADAPKELILSIDEKFPDSRLQGLSLNKSQQLFATTPKGEPIPLLEGDPPKISAHGQKLVSMLQEASALNSESKVDVNFILPRSSFTKSTAIVQRQLKALLEDAEKELGLTSGFKDVIKIVRRDAFDKKTLTYRESLSFDEFIDSKIHESVSTNGESVTPSQAHVATTDSKGIGQDSSNLLDTFVLFCMPSFVGLETELKDRVGGIVGGTISEGIHATLVSPAILQSTSQIFVGAGFEQENIESEKHFEPTTVHLTNTQEKKEVEASTVQNEEETAAIDNNIGANQVVGKSESITTQSDPLQLDTLQSEDQSPNSEENRLPENITERVPARLSRIQSIQELLFDDEIEIFEDPANYNSPPLKDDFHVDKILLSYRGLFEDLFTKEEVDKIKSDGIWKILEQMEKLHSLIIPILDARIAGHAPREIPQRDELLRSFNQAGAQIMKSLAQDTFLTVQQQTETWKMVEVLRGIAGILADEPSMLPWKVSPIGPHHGKVKRIDARTGDITIELDDDKRWVIWKDPNRPRRSSDARPASSSVKIGDPVIAHVAILSPPVDHLSKDGAKKSVNFKGETVNNHWRASRFERTSDSGNKTEEKPLRGKKKLAHNSTRNHPGKKPQESST